MSVLFLSRRNIHAKYYKKLLSFLDCKASLYIFGKPSLSAFNYLSVAVKVDFSKVIEHQLRRKQAKGSFWKNRSVSQLYSRVLLVHERCRFAKYYALLKQKKPVTVVIWNGNKLPNITVAKAANALNIPVYYFENGLLPGTTSLDPAGVNSACSLPRDKHFYHSFDPDNKLPFSAPEIIAREQHKKRKVKGEIELPKRFIFVPFQVPHDTQIACFSPWVESMEMLFDVVTQAVDKMQDADIKLVFKEHPSWHKHYPQLYNKHADAIFANANCTKDLIAQSEAVITINSSVGLEALQLGKNVITLGDACFNIDDLVLHATNEQELSQSLKALQAGWKLDLILRDKFFSYLEHVYSVKGRWQDCDDEHMQAVEQRLLKQDAFADNSNARKEFNEKHHLSS